MNALLEKCELQVAMLLELCQSLTLENIQLKEKQAEILQEKNRLLEKNQTATDKVKQLLNILKNSVNEEIL